MNGKEKIPDFQRNQYIGWSSFSRHLFVFYSAGIAFADRTFFDEFFPGWIADPFPTGSQFYKSLSRDPCRPERPSDIRDHCSSCHGHCDELSWIFP
jgi:hypothetical protein